jgi:hypothetical protein
MSSTMTTPLQIDQPYNIVVFLSFFSPIILVTLITFLSFVFQNFKGLIYLGYVLAAAVVRHYIYYVNGGTPFASNGGVCSSIKYSEYGNATFSVFVFSFSIMYLFLPMFINKSANYWIFSALIGYGLLDVLIKYNNQCYSGISEILLNSLYGLTIGASIVMLMYAGNASKYLFFNEMNTGESTCSRPANQQFKCKAYKNGELLGPV